jgi:hypothetical protein
MEDYNMDNSAPTAPVLPTVKTLSGFDEGTEIISDGQKVTIKGDYDKDGNAIGWHQEPVNANEVHPTGDPTGTLQPIIADPNTTEVTA